MLFFATAAKGMEQLLADELKALGASEIKAVRAGVSFQGTLETAYRACLWSRTANRILLPLKTFPAPTPEKLYGGVKSIRWSDHLTPKQTMAVDFSATESKITHTHFAALKVKDAVVDQLRSTQGERPSINTARPDLRINVYLFKDEATVSLDLSGDSLHKRGYREEGTPAPLKENLAAAILLMADWPKRLEEHGSSWAFLDPMCGSGTLPLEAAMIAAKIAPGIGRTYFGFLGWLGHVPLLWSRLLEEAKDQVIRDRKKLPKIVAYDRDFRAIRVAIENIEKAGLRNLIHVEKRELSECDRIAEHGSIVLNPPYGERMGEEEALVGLYGEIGDQFKQKFQGWEGFVFTGNRELSKKIGLKASRRFVLYNGALECRLLKYELYK